MDWFKNYHIFSINWLLVGNIISAMKVVIVLLKTILFNVKFILDQRLSKSSWPSESL